MIEKQEKPIVGHILKTTPVEFKTEESTPEIQEAIDYFKNSEAEVTFETDIDGDKFFEALGIKKENNFGRMQYRVSALLNLIEKQQKEIENSVSKDKIREKQILREFELQQEYKEFKEDTEWNRYNELLEE